MTRYAVQGYYVEGYAADDSVGTAEFIWDKHRYSTTYAEGDRVELGGSYMFSAEPDGPDQRVFTLYFDTMFYFTNAAGQLDKTILPTINFGAFEDFYKEHRLWKTFTYNHPIYGQLAVKFAKPLQTPKGLANGNGALEAFSIDLVEIP